MNIPGYSVYEYYKDKFPTREDVAHATSLAKAWAGTDCSTYLVSHSDPLLLARQLCGYLALTHPPPACRDTMWWTWLTKCQLMISTPQTMASADAPPVTLRDRVMR